MFFRSLAISLVLLGIAASGAAQPIRLAPDAGPGAQVRHLDGGIVEIRATAANPTLLLTVPGGEIAPEKTPVLSFEYFAEQGSRTLRVRAGASPQSLRRIASVPGGLSACQSFMPFAVDLSREMPLKDARWKVMRIDLAMQPGQTLQIRAIVLRARTAGEDQTIARKQTADEQNQQLAEALNAYLKHAYPCQVKQVRVDDQRVHVEVDLRDQSGELFLAECPIWREVVSGGAFAHVEALKGRKGSFTVDLPRYAPLEGRSHDALLSRWVIIRRSADGDELLSHARYADEIHARAALPAEKPRSKKGIGGFSAFRGATRDLDDLGISAVTVNILLSQVLRAGPGPDAIPFQYNGQTYYASAGQAARLDATLLEAAKRKIVVLAIVLVPRPGGDRVSRMLGHPDADPAGHFAMPNLISRDGAEWYGAALDFLAERYSRPDGKYGRIHHWIAHNEVDAGWEWTNCGHKPQEIYMDLYVRSMRMIYGIARKYDPNARVFISLTHFWNWTPDRRFYLPRQLLETLLDYSHTEGDFDWSIAYHPYPESLFKPRTWEDKRVSFSFDTDLITPKNIEVLDAWTKQPRTFFRGRTPRIVHLSEQGPNSPDYSAKSLADQAASMAYTWKKIEHLSSIEAYEYHNWIDNRGEGGLRIGLRRFPDDPDQPLGPKPIWHVYQKLGTRDEDKACAFALPIIGIRDWNEIIYRGEIK